MRKQILSPSILSADFGDLARDIDTIAKAGAQYVHIDVMDGVFVPQISIGMPVIKSIRKTSELVFDVHLMIIEPEHYIEEFAACGADIITFHLEASKDPGMVIDKIRACGKKVGISVKPDTRIEAVYPYLDKVDMVLVMTVEPGFGGQKYIEFCTEKVKALYEEINARGLNVDIEVDGGINNETAQTALDAGANVLVAGSAVFKNDITANTQYFLSLMNKQ